MTAGSRGALLTILLMAAMFVFGVLLYVPDDIWGVLLLAVIVGLTFIVGFCRGYGVCDRRWTSQAGKIGAVLKRAGVPVAIIPPGGSHHPFERLL